MLISYDQKAMFKTKYATLLYRPSKPENKHFAIYICLKSAFLQMQETTKNLSIFVKTVYLYWYVS